MSVTVFLFLQPGFLAGVFVVVCEEDGCNVRVFRLSCFLAKSVIPSLSLEGL